MAGEGAARARAVPGDPQQLKRQGETLREAGRGACPGMWHRHRVGFHSAGERGAQDSHPAAGGSVPRTVALTVAVGGGMCSQPLAPLPGAAAFPQPLRPVPTLGSVSTAEICICCKFQQTKLFLLVSVSQNIYALGQTRPEAKPGQVLLRVKRPSVSTHA